MELKANELRMGNLIEINAPITNKIIVVDVYHISELKKNKEFFKPIPLTEECLLKFGFEKSNSGFTFDLEKLSICMPCDSYVNGRVYFNSWCILEQSIKYVHQLQNIYFALTNKELEIKM